MVVAAAADVAMQDRRHVGHVRASERKSLRERLGNLAAAA
jgi:hypothetical protein